MYSVMMAYFVFCKGQYLNLFCDDGVFIYLCCSLFRDKPEVRFAAEDGTEHSVWPVRDPVDVFAIQRAFEGVKTTYIADGHHRSASAFR